MNIQSVLEITRILRIPILDLSAQAAKQASGASERVELVVFIVIVLVTIRLIVIDHLVMNAAVIANITRHARFFQVARHVAAARAARNARPIADSTWAASWRT